MSRIESLLPAFGAVLAAVAVALSAAASHALTTRLDPDDLRRVWIAAALLFGHGAVLATSTTWPATRAARAARVLLAVGAMTFAGALLGRALAGASSALAPWGGSTLILGWLLLALGLFPRPASRDP